MQTKKKLVILTGSGMSAESGLATFRGSGGLWGEYRIEDVATPEGFCKNPKLVLDFYNARRRELLQTEPNEGHHNLKDLESKYDVTIITQNVDDLHERAGSSNIIHLHGELMKVQSTAYPHHVYDMTADKLDISLDDKDENGNSLRPFIVWFGEPVPKIEDAIEESRKADIFIVIGTSLNVYPAASLLYYIQKGTPVYLIDPNDVNINVQIPNLHIIKKGASEGSRELKNILLTEN